MLRLISKHSLCLGRNSLRLIQKTPMVGGAVWLPHAKSVRELTTSYNVLQRFGRTHGQDNEFDDDDTEEVFIGKKQSRGNFASNQHSSRFQKPYEDSDYRPRSYGQSSHHHREHSSTGFNYDSDHRPRSFGHNNREHSNSGFNRRKPLSFFDDDYKPEKKVANVRSTNKAGLVSAEDWQKSRAHSRPPSSAASQSDVPDPSEVYADMFTRFLNLPDNKVKELMAKRPQKFSDITKLDPRLKTNLQHMGLNNMTPVQQFAWLLYEMECDMLASAQTGSGKTIAFLLPLVNSLLCNYPHQAMQLVANDPVGTQFPSALILAPTRELAQQIHQVALQLCDGTPVECGVFFGGENINRQMNDLDSRGCHIAVATPGRLVDHLQRDSISLAACRELVLDEADRMLDMGFEPQIRRIVEAPAHKMPKASERSTALFSATFPTEVRRLARDFVRGQTSSQSGFPQCVEFVVADTMNAERGDILPSNVKHEWHVKSSFRDIFMAVLQCIRETEGDNKRVLVFMNKKADVDGLDKMLYRQNVQCAAIHGDKSQRARDEALQSFRDGDVSTLLATNVAARGLDIPEVGLVINVGLPQATDDYVHRCGRTGRLGREGRCVNLIVSADVAANRSLVSELNSVLKRSNQPLIPRG